MGHLGRLLIHLCHLLLTMHSSSSTGNMDLNGGVTDPNLRANMADVFPSGML